MTPVFGVLVGTSLTITLLILYIAIKLKSLQSRSCVKSHDEKQSFENGHKIISTSSKLFKCDDSDEIDPDLIPLQYGSLIFDFSF